MTAYDESGMGVSEYEARKESSRKDARIAELTAEVDRLTEALTKIRMDTGLKPFDMRIIARNALREVG